MNTFSLLIKPASADCNLRCAYCFYKDHLKEGVEAPRMSDEILKIMIKSYLKTNQNKSYSFGWQGGEPTIMGLKFFKKVVELQQKYAPPGSIINNAIQTNGTLITQEMAIFFAKYKFLVGVSLDGPPDLHDYYRKTIGLTPTHSLVMNGIDYLRKNKVEFNILILVNNKTIKHPIEIYHYLKENGFYYHQYIPCVEFDEFNNPFIYSISGNEWGVFLCELFDQWINKDISKVSIRLFDSILEYLIYERYNICTMNKNCCQYFVVEYNGNVYPCDFFVRNELLLGNIKSGSWEEFLNSPLYHQFGKQKAIWNKICNSCPFLNLCHGDCQKNRLGDLEKLKTLSALCKGWKKFYAYALPRLIVLANKIKIEKRIKTSLPIKFKKIGRNDLCPCGSSKKYKNCCMK